MKLNTDGCSKEKQRLADVSGVARDCNGRVLFAFRELLGEHNNLYAEIAIVIQWLELCWVRNLTKIWLEIDALVLLHIMAIHQHGHWTLQHFPIRLRQLQRVMEIRDSHIQNQVADWLASQACVGGDLKIYNADEPRGSV